jgi:hypothetical protein
MPEPAGAKLPAERQARETTHVHIDERSTAFDSAIWVTPAEAAALVGISSSSIRRAAGAGTIRGQRAGGSGNSPWLVHLEDVKARWTHEPDEPAESTERAESTEPEGDAKVVKRHSPKLPSQIREQLLLPEPEPRWWQRRGR